MLFKNVKILNLELERRAFSHVRKKAGTRNILSLASSWLAMPITRDFRMLPIDLRSTYFFFLRPLKIPEILRKFFRLPPPPLACRNRAWDLRKKNRKKYWNRGDNKP